MKLLYYDKYTVTILMRGTLRNEWIEKVLTAPCYLEEIKAHMQNFWD